MHHRTELIRLILTSGVLAVVARAGSRIWAKNRLTQSAREHPRVFLAVAGVVYTAIVLQWSARNGRVGMDPQWDDVAYLLDAEQRLHIFDWQDILKLIRSFWNFPPHSPWSTACALLAFVILGVHAWAPYVLNVVLILGLLLSLYWLLPALPAGRRLLLSAVPLLLPISARLVQEFRPDPALGVATAVFCLGTLKLSFFCPALAARWQTHFKFGLVAGLALLIKPSFLYHTLVIMVLTQACAAASLYLSTRQPLARANRLECVAAFFGGALLVAGGYYVRALPETLSYIHTNTANSQEVEIHRLHAHTFGVLRNFLIDGEMARMLGPFLLIFFIVIALGMVYFFYHRRWLDAGYVASGLVCVAASIAILAYAHLDNPFFGIFWELVLVMVGLHVVAQVYQAGAAGKRIASGFALLTIVVFLAHSPFVQFYPPSPDALADQSLNRAVVLKIGQTWAETNEGGKRAARVAICFGGQVNCPAQIWLARKLNYPLELWDCSDAGSVDAQIHRVASPDFIEAADPDSRWLFRWLPGVPLQRELLERLRADPTFSELPAVIGHEGKVYIFRRSELPHG